MFTLEDAEYAAEALGIDWDEVEFSPEDLLAGLEVELEHGTENEVTNVTDDDLVETAMIAYVHLLESPLYYDALSAMEEELDERTASYRRAYEQTRKGPWKKPTLSPELQQFTNQYLQQIAQVIKGGMSADDAFKKLQPDLDKLSADVLVNLLGENPQIGQRPLADLKDVVMYGDLFTGVQTFLERTIWEAAVLWWGEQATEKADQDINADDAVQKEPDEQGTKVERPVQQPKSKGKETVMIPSTGASVLTFAGYRYEA